MKITKKTKNHLNALAKSLSLDLAKNPGITLQKGDDFHFLLNSGSYNGLQIALDDKDNYRVVVNIKIVIRTNFNNLFSEIISRLKFNALKEYAIMISRIDIVVNRIQF